MKSRIKKENFKFSVVIGRQMHMFLTSHEAKVFILSLIEKEMKTQGISSTYSLIDLVEQSQTIVKAFIKEEEAKRFLVSCAEAVENDLTKEEEMENFWTKAGKHVIPGGYTVAFNYVHTIY
ncbi:MAG: hypothetical protein K2G88_09490 [Oscillospiraceae bacterium]|nr:hypothetical protein [Oscillospiraceae bacterium]